MRHINRIPLTGPTGAYQTYRIQAPVATHYRPATCAEVDCPHHTGGWATIVDTTSELGQDQADYIRHRSGKRFTETAPGPGQIRFEFPPGQACFRSGDHRVPLERDPLFSRYRGDPARGLTGRVGYDRGDQWVDDFAEHQTHLKQERGQ